MHTIDNIEIKNFKSIRHANIEGCKKVNVFVGPPNVGKSNILEALGLLTFIRQKRPVGLKDLVRIEKLTQLFRYFNITEPINISFNNNYSLLINYKDEEKVGFTLKDKRDQDSLYSAVVYAESLRIGVESLFSSTTNEIDDFSGRFKEIEKLNVKPYKFSSARKFNETFSALELKIPTGTNMFEVIINNEKITNEFLELLKPYGLVLLIDRDENIIKIAPEIKSRTVYSIPISLIADTLIRLIFFKTAIHSSKDSVLIFEEPEAHLFPRYISKLTGETILNENNNQYFMATHSPYVLNDLINDLGYDDLALFIVSFNKEKGETIIQKMTESEMDEAYQFGYDFFMNINNFIQQPQHD